jgi:beta-catenin-like protein 1
VLNFALSRSSSSTRNGSNKDCDDDAYKIACETFVTAGGLKLLFPLYMARKSVIPCPAACSDGGSALAKKKKGGQVSKRARRATNARKQWLMDVERNVIYIMYSLTRQIHVTSRDDAYSRVLVKFVEEDCEKCDRTIELCLKYDERARIAEYQYYRSDEADEAERLGMDVETAALGAKLRGGVDLFHCSCAILSFACVGSKRCRGHIMEQLKLQGACISGELVLSIENAFSFFFM